MLDAITPVILTFNEAPNIARTLQALFWAEDIVVVDSGSTDDTLSILAGHPHVRVFSRPFDTHSAQWDFATTATGIRTPWILRLDADYLVTPKLVEELRNLDADSGYSAYRISFDYAVFGRKLPGSAYPPNTVLLRNGSFSVVDHGHTEKWVVGGTIGTLRARIVHDDRKSLGTWLRAQDRYMQREHERLVASAGGGVRDWLRRHPPLMPLAMMVYCLVGRGLLFAGPAGLHYTLQRVLAESALSLRILESRLRSNDGGDVDRPIISASAPNPRRPSAAR